MPIGQLDMQHLYHLNYLIIVNIYYGLYMYLWLVTSCIAL